jgi:hypothetical protein
MSGKFFYELNSGCLQDGKGQTSSQKENIEINTQRTHC